MGGKNWVMFQVARIAELHERIIQASQRAEFDCGEFGKTAVDISDNILCGLATEGCSMSEETLDQHELVTHMFARMASIYLHLVTHGFQQLEALDTTISGAFQAFQTLVPKDILPALVCPLFVIGSVAREEQEQFFRTAFSSLPLLDPSTRHRARILPVLEEIWSQRRATPRYSWNDSVQLTRDVLLI
jgi:hypothetical protein